MPFQLDGVWAPPYNLPVTDLTAAGLSTLARLWWRVRMPAARWRD